MVILVKFVSPDLSPLIVQHVVSCNMSLPSAHVLVSTLGSGCRDCAVSRRFIHLVRQIFMPGAMRDAQARSRAS
jgi:hypothetical protein